MCLGAVVFGYVYGHYGPVAMYLSSSCWAAFCFISYTALYLLVPALRAPPPKSVLQPKAELALVNGDLVSKAQVNTSVPPSYLSATGDEDASRLMRDELSDDSERQVVLEVPHSETAQSFVSVDSKAPLLHSSPSRLYEHKQPLSDIPEHSVPTRSPTSDQATHQTSLRERMGSARSRFFLS